MHQFHFMLSQVDKVRIIQFAKKSGKSVSKVVRQMIEESLWLLDKKQYQRADNHNKYEKGQISCHRYINLKKEQYRKLKQIHDVNQFYSIAQVLRGLVLFYLNGLELFGEDGFRKLLKKENLKFKQKQKNLDRKQHMWLKYKANYLLFFDFGHKLIGIVKNIN